MSWGIFCPVCGCTRSHRSWSETRQRKVNMWSQSQWTRNSAVLHYELGVCNVEQNCCSECSLNYYIEPGTKPARPAPHGCEAPCPGASSAPSPPPASHSATNGPASFGATCCSGPCCKEFAEFELRCKSLKKKLCDGFWLKFHDDVNQIGFQEKNYQYILQHVEDTLRRHPEWNWQTRPSPLKWLSYHGAVLTHGQVAPCFTSTEGELKGERYFEPGNATYKHVLRMLWPSALPGYEKRETIGDVIEAFLGYAYLMREGRVPFQTRPWGPFQIQIIADLHFVLLYVFVHWDTKFT